MGGLTTDLRHNVLIYHPANLNAAKWLARASDNCRKSTRTQSLPFPVRFSPGSGFHPPDLPPTSAPSSVVSGQRPIPLLTQAEVQDCPEKNLCFNCDEVIAANDLNFSLLTQIGTFLTNYWRRPLPKKLYMVHPRISPSTRSLNLLLPFTLSRALLIHVQCAFRSPLANWALQFSSIQAPPTIC